MNGAPIGQPQVKSPAVDLLEQALAAAKTGQIDTVGIVSVNPVGATGTMFAGNRMGDLKNGLDMLAIQVLFGIMGINLHELRPRRSPIVRVPGLAG